MLSDPLVDTTASISELLKRELNQPQLEAATHFVGPILVLAGAGSGKTRVLTYRIANLVATHGVRPDQILAVTFTNKATEEMRHRLRHILGEKADELWVSTFHAAGLRIIRRHAERLQYAPGFVVYDDNDCNQLLKSIIKEQGLQERKLPPQFFYRIIDRAKNDYLFPEDLARDARTPDQHLAAKIYSQYQQVLLKANAVDFGDLLAQTVRLFEQEPEILRYYQTKIKFVLVDEFQDTNLVQYRLLHLLTKLHKNLFVVGDDDQSIYSFRGANIRNILEFNSNFPEAKLVKLEQNYRSTSVILDAANSVIAENASRKPKELWTAKKGGEPITTYVAQDEIDEAAFIVKSIEQHIKAGRTLSEVALLYRTNAQSRALEEALMDAGFPYRIFGGMKFYERKEIKDIVAYLRLVANERDNQAFIRIVNTPPRGVGPQTLRNIAERAEDSGTSLLQAAEELAASSKTLRPFCQLISRLRELARQTTLSEFIKQTIELSEYGPALKVDKDPNAESRLENLAELTALGRSMEDPSEDHLVTIQRFLDRIALVSSIDVPEEHGKVQIAPSPSDSRPQAVSLMTLHLAKGLEFPIVFLAGLEEGLLPHRHSIDDPAGLEEERRLCYVGITRAKENLYLTRATTRGMFSAGGSSGFSGYFRMPSRFVKDIPAELTSNIGEEPFSSGKSFSAEMIFDDEEAAETFKSFEGDEEVVIRRFGKRSKPKRDKSKWQSQLIAADALDTSRAIRPGSLVNHPSFGEGFVEAIEGDLEGDLRDVRVTIAFEDFDEPKTLMLKFAKLAVLS